MSSHKVQLQQSNNRILPYFSLANVLGNTNLRTIFGIIQIYCRKCDYRKYNNQIYDYLKRII